MSEEKNLDYYMSLPYRIEIYPEPDESGYTAEIPDLPGCLTCADTLAELWEMIEDARRGWLEVALERGLSIPEPRLVSEEAYSGQFLVRMPIDPITEEEGWGMRSYQDDFDSDSWGGENLYDIYSLSDKKALDGTYYRDW